MTRKNQILFLVLLCAADVGKCLFSFLCVLIYIVFVVFFCFSPIRLCLKVSYLSEEKMGTLPGCAEVPRGFLGLPDSLVLVPQVGFALNKSQDAWVARVAGVVRLHGCSGCPGSIT